MYIYICLREVGGKPGERDWRDTRDKEDDKRRKRPQSGGGVEPTLLFSSSPSSPRCLPSSFSFSLRVSVVVFSPLPAVSFSRFSHSLVPHSLFSVGGTTKRSRSAYFSSDKSRRVTFIFPPLSLAPSPHPVLCHTPSFPLPITSLAVASSSTEVLPPCFLCSSSGPWLLQRRHHFLFFFSVLFLAVFFSLSLSVSRLPATFLVIPASFLYARSGHASAALDPSPGLLVRRGSQSNLLALSAAQTLGVFLPSQQHVVAAERLQRAQGRVQAVRDARRGRLWTVCLCIALHQQQPLQPS